MTGTNFELNVLTLRAERLGDAVFLGAFFKNPTDRSVSASITVCSLRLEIC